MTLHPTVRALAAAIPDFALAALFLLTWLEPLRFGDGMVSRLMLLMLLEFIIVHSAGFAAAVYVGRMPRPRKVLALAGLSLLYTLFVGAFALAFRESWPLWSFWGLMFNRMLGVLLDPVPADDGLMALGAGWAMSVVFYLGGVFLTVIGPVPRLGVTPELLPRLGLTGGGVWVDEPQRVLAFGVVYFAAQGAWELFLGVFRGRRAGSSMLTKSIGIVDNQPAPHRTTTPGKHR